MGTLLFIHGFGTSPKIWKLQVQEFSKDHRVITSPVEIKEEREIFIIGWSMGAFEAVKFYFEHRERVKALILVSATPKFLKSKSYPHGLSPALLRNLERKLKANFKSGLEYFYGLMFNGGELHPLIHELPTPDREEIFEQLERLKVEDMRSSLSKIEVPVLLLHGDKDQICLLEASKYMHERIPYSQLQIFQGVGHVPFLEETEKFNFYVRSFISAG